MAIEVPLVIEIEKHECLYNFNLPEYNRKDVLEQAWTEVAANVNLPVNECKDKWKNIRSSYLRSLKCSGGKLKKPYYLTNYLQFVLPYLKPMGNNIEMNSEDLQSSEETVNEDIVNHMPIMKVEPVEFVSDQITFDPIEVIPIQLDVDEPEPERFEMRKRRRQTMSKKSLFANQRINKNKKYHTSGSTRAENCALKYFLLSLLPEFETMDEEQIRLFKIKVMMLMQDIKTDSSTIKKDLPSQGESDRLQKRLINLLIKNLGK